MLLEILGELTYYCTFHYSIRMSKQLTLFGKRAVLASYFTNPINDYQRFVNKKWNEASEKFGRKQDFLQFALVEWEKVKNYKETLAAFNKILLLN